MLAILKTIKYLNRHETRFFSSPAPSSLLALCNKKKAKSPKFTINLHKKFSFSEKDLFQEEVSCFSEGKWIQLQFQSLTRTYPQRRNGREKINELEESTFLRKTRSSKELPDPEDYKHWASKGISNVTNMMTTSKSTSTRERVSHLSSFHCSRIDFHSLPWLREKFPFHQLACCFFRTSFQNGIPNATYCELFFNVMEECV